MKIVWHVKFSIDENEETIEAAKKQAQSFVLITNIPSDEMDNQTLLWHYKKHYVVEAGFRWLRQPSMASTIFLKRPERIEALMMLIHVALMIRALMQQQARLRVKEGKHSTLIDLTGQKLLNPTADKILVLLINHAVITDGDEHYYAGYPDKDFERLQTMLNLLGITEGYLWPNSCFSEFKISQIGVVCPNGGSTTIRLVSILYLRIILSACAGCKI